jgi:putative ABC transport system permease protein
LLKVGLKGLLARKLRTALTGVAVVIGVAFVSGTFVFTDAIDASFKDLFERTQKGTDVSVQGRLAVEEDFAPPPTMPADTLQRVRAVAGVDEAFGSVSSENGTLLDDKGEPIVSNGPPTIIVTAGPERFDPLTYVEGHKAETPDEVVIDKATADKYGFGVGDTVTVTVSAPKKDYSVAGVATVGDSENLAGSRLVQMTLDEARRVSGHDGYDDISVAASSGTSPEQLKAAIAAQLPGKDFTVLTGKEQADKSASDLSEALGFIRIALLVFAGIALLVGGFLIFNTFAITVAQRTKEFALLRTLGASRAQVLRSVLAETVAIGVLASVIGIAAGLATAPGLRALLAAFGLELGGTSLPLEPRTIIAGFAVGIVATVVSGFVPARRATRVQPIEAMRDAVLPTGAHLRRRRIVVAILVEIVGLVLLSYALFGDLPTTGAVASTMGLGAVIMMFGLALIAPVLVRPMSSAIGRPLERIMGLTGRLARENTRRQPQRTAVTASALMIGLALVVFVTIFAAGLRATIDQGIDDQVRAAGIVKSVSFLPLPEGVTEQLETVDGVAAVSPLQFETGKLKSDGKNVPLTGVDPATITQALQLEWNQGSERTLGDLGDSDVVVSETFADAHSLAVGDSITLITPRGREIAYTLAGTYDVKVGLVGDVVISNASLDRDWKSKDVAFAMVISDPGTDADELRQAEEKALTGFPTAEAQTIDDFKQEQSDGVGTLVNLIYALLSLSIIVALVGVVNTLALSVHERTRELGMLRAVGMSRWQVRQMIGSESVITAVLGALLGIVLGVVFAALIARPLADEGFVFELPILTLIGVTVLAALAGVVAAIQPARRAANVDVLRAVTTE